jgi:hypothetical protein
MVRVALGTHRHEQGKSGRAAYELGIATIRLETRHDRDK